MVQTLPVLIALIICILDYNVFISYNPEHIAPLSPLLASHIMKIAFYFILLDFNLYRRSFRKISNFALGIFEFIISIFFMESTLAYGWFPLEKKIMMIVPNILKYAYYNFSNSAILRYVVESLSTNYFLMFVSYVISVIFLCCVLHATRAVDFRLISYFSWSVFFNDAVKKFRKGIVRLFYRINVFGVNRQESVESYYSVQNTFPKIQKCNVGCGRYFT